MNLIYSQNLRVGGLKPISRTGPSDTNDPQVDSMSNTDSSHRRAWIWNKYSSASQQIFSLHLFSASKRFIWDRWIFQIYRKTEQQNRGPRTSKTTCRSTGISCSLLVSSTLFCCALTSPQPSFYATCTNHRLQQLRLEREYHFHHNELFSCNSHTRLFSPNQTLCTQKTLPVIHWIVATYLESVYYWKFKVKLPNIKFWPKPQPTRRYRDSQSGLAMWGKSRVRTSATKSNNGSQQVGFTPYSAI